MVKNKKRIVQITWVAVLGPSWLGTELTWDRVDLGPSCFGTELTGTELTGTEWLGTELTGTLCFQGLLRGIPHNILPSFTSAFYFTTSSCSFPVFWFSGPFRNHGFCFGFDRLKAPSSCLKPERVCKVVTKQPRGQASLSLIQSRSRGFERDLWLKKENKFKGQLIF